MSADQTTEQPSTEQRPPEAPARGLQRVVGVLRRITAPIQPWDFDEPAARHWWDVYAR